MNNRPADADDTRQRTCFARSAARRRAANVCGVLVLPRLAVIAVTDAWDALAAAPRVDVILTGILLAGSMDGIELITRLRRDARSHHRPIIVLSACAWVTERERAARAGCDMFPAKPACRTNCCVTARLVGQPASRTADTGVGYGMSQSNAHPNHDKVAAARARVEDIVAERQAAKEAARQGREA